VSASLAEEVGDDGDVDVLVSAQGAGDPAAGAVVEQPV
jgi:hypothetical protein